MVIKTIRDIKLGRNKVTLCLEEDTLIEIPRREAAKRFLEPAGDYDNGKWTAITTYRKLIGRDVQVEDRTLKRFYGPGVFDNHTVDPRPVVTPYHRNYK